MSNMVEKLESDGRVQTGITFARCNLKWFKENMIHKSQENQTQCWEIVSMDKNGPLEIRVTRGVAKRVEHWYRTSYSKSDAEFEKRLEYPLGADIEETEPKEVYAGLN